MHAFALGEPADEVDERAAGPSPAARRRRSAADAGSVRSACDEVEAARARRRARARARRTTARRRASRRRAACASPRRPRPPVPPVTIAVRSMSGPLLVARLDRHAHSAYAVRARPYGLRHARAGPHRRIRISTRSCSCAPPSCGSRRDGGDVPAADARRPQRPGRRHRLGGRRGAARAVRARAARARRAGASSATRATARRSSSRALTEPLPGTFDLADLVDGPPRSAQPDGGRPARARRDHPGPAPARAARPHPRRAHRELAPLPQRARRQALPPGLRPRPARALALGRPGACTAIAAHLPGHRPRRRRHRRAAARHRQARGLRRRRRRRIDLTDAGRLQGEIPLGYYRIRREIEDIPGFPPEHRAGRAAHHPQPPRLARARQPGRPVHARGHARAP